MADDLPRFERDELETFVQQYMELDRRTQRPQGIYSILSASREKKYQDTLQYFLNPRKSHGFRYALLNQFFECIDFYEYNLPNQHIDIDDEVWIGDDGIEGRIDLVIAGGSALGDHPRWAVFLELKVGAEEGTEQTPTYAAADTWNFSWFDENELVVDDLESKKYVYLKREAADTPTDSTFETVTWADVAKSFESGTQASLFEYPNRSVIQFTDFIQSLKETEGMDSAIDEDELNERLNVYFEHSDLIQQVERANSQFESDFDDVTTYLQNNWVDKIVNKYDVEKSGWNTSVSSNAEYQKLFPEYWDQDPLNSTSTIQLFYRHSPTTELLRNQTLRFRLRLPPARNAHTETQDTGHSFNTLFAEKCTTKYGDRIHDVLTKIGVDEIRLGSASALAVKDYPLDPHNLVGSYFDQLDTAVSEFCTPDSGLPIIINDVFEDVYRDVFGEDPTGEFSGGLHIKE
ncbi:PD-(D/E)XK nuclease family protein [Halorubrum tibetense]|uniref:PD-(D/E)XK nuclease family protein n=1 Tax=Halorubrum tibetense TaxID=175631 RepID=A0ABD5S8U2_9EURY